jgi:hypothetical protein
MEQLEKLMEKLNTDTLCSVSIYDKVQGVYVCTNLSHLKIQQDYGCAEDYFESIYSEGHTNLTVQERRKNGNSIKNIGSPFDVAFGNTNNKQDVETKPEKQEKAKKKKDTPLNVNEIIDLKIASIRAVELQKQNDELKAKLKKSKKKHKVLEREKLNREFTVQKSDSFNNMLLGAIKQAPTIMAGLGMNVPNANPTSGLGAVYDDGDTSDFTDVKIEFLELIKTLEDDTIELLNTIYKKVTINDDDGAFSNELVELLQKHNMIIV